MITKILTTDSPVGRAVVCAASEAGIAVEVVGDIVLAAATASRVIVIAKNKQIDRLAAISTEDGAAFRAKLILICKWEISERFRSATVNIVVPQLLKSGVSTVAIWTKDDPALEAPVAVFLGAVFGEVSNHKSTTEAEVPAP